METKLKIAIQKSGRLNESSIKILKEAGIEFDNGLNKLRINDWYVFNCNRPDCSINLSMVVVSST